MNKKIVVILGILLAAVVFIFILFPKNSGTTSKSKEELTSIRIGWQTTWATQGQIASILKRKDFLEENRLHGEFKGFASGAPLNEAALAKEVDVLFTADQPAATLLSKNNSWIIIARLMYNRVSLYVPPNSPIQNILDLRGKTIGMPFGAAAQRMVLLAEIQAGLDPTKDTNNINIGILEQSDLVKDPTVTKWGDIDALAGFDPTPAIFEEKGLIRNVKVGSVVAVVMMSRDFIAQNPNAPVDFLKAFGSSYDFYRSNPGQANSWFIEESKLNVSTKALQLASSVEPNLQAKSPEDLRFSFTDDDYEKLQEAADFIYSQSLVKNKIVMKDHIDVSFIKKANLK